MILKMRCQYCSCAKDVSCELTHSASRRIEIAKENGWYAHQATTLAIPLYFCSESCEHKFRVSTRTHLEIVGRVTR